MSLVWEILTDVDHQAGLAIWGPCQLFQPPPNANRRPSAQWELRESAGNRQLERCRIAMELRRNATDVPWDFSWNWWSHGTLGNL